MRRSARKAMPQAQACREKKDALSTREKDTPQKDLSAKEQRRTDTGVKRKQRDENDDDEPALFLTQIPKGGAHAHPDLAALAALIDEDDVPPKAKRKKLNTSTLGTAQVELALL